jgi:hypothetical protein
MEFLDHMSDGDSVVGIATGYGLGDRGIGVRVPVGFKNFLHVVQTGCVVHPTSYRMDTGLERPGREADHSPPASAEVKKMRIYTSVPHTPSWRSASLVKHRDTFKPEGRGFKSR